MTIITSSHLGEHDKLLNAIGFYNSKHVELANKSLSSQLSTLEQKLLASFKHVMSNQNHGEYNSVSSWTDFGVSSLYDFWEDRDHPSAFDNFIPKESCFRSERLNEQYINENLKPWYLS